MAATAAIASTTTVGASATVTLAAGAACHFVVTNATGAVPGDAIVDVAIQTSTSKPRQVKRMTKGDFTCRVDGPGDYVVTVVSLGKAGTALVVDKNV